MLSTACSKSPGFLLQVYGGSSHLSDLVTDIPHRRAQLILDAIKLTVKINYHTSQSSLLMHPYPFSVSLLSPMQNQYLKPPPFHAYSALPNLQMFTVSHPTNFGSFTSHQYGLFLPLPPAFQGSLLPYAMPVTHPSRSYNAQCLISSFVSLPSLLCTVQSQNFYLVCLYAFSLAQSPSLQSKL